MGVDPNHFYFTATPEEWEAAMDALANALAPIFRATDHAVEHTLRQTTLGSLVEAIA